MKLPNFEKALISREKITDYLLSETHEDGRHKAAFFNVLALRQRIGKAWPTR